MGIMFGMRIGGSDHYFALKRPEVSESQVCFEVAGTGIVKMKMQIKALEVKWMKSVRFWNLVVNRELNIVPVFQRLNQIILLKLTILLRLFESEISTAVNH
jgi:hypothetical protein